jgi:hypothetical protein
LSLPRLALHMEKFQESSLRTLCAVNIGLWNGMAMYVIYDTSHLKCLLNVLKLKGKHFIDPKRSEILSVFQVFPCTTQIAVFLPKLLPALFLKKPWYPCPFELLTEALNMRWRTADILQYREQTPKTDKFTEVTSTNNKNLRYWSPWIPSHKDTLVLPKWCLQKPWRFMGVEWPNWLMAIKTS